MQLVPCRIDLSEEIGQRRFGMFVDAYPVLVFLAKPSIRKMTSKHLRK
jgi:hypothetical protein